MGSKKSAGGRAARAEVAGAQQGIDEIRRQFGATQQRFGETQARLDPFIEAGQGALGAVQRGGTVKGLESIIGEILGGGAFQELVGERERSARGQLAAGGLTRSGTALEEISAIPTDLAFEIENLLFGRQAGIAEQGRGAALGLGQLAGQLGSQGGRAAGQAGDFFRGQGASTGAGILTNAQAQAEGTKQAIGLASAIFFSDERLKENIEVVSKIGDLDVVEWDWKDFAKGTAIVDGGTLGFVAQEVEKKYPQHVSEYCGWKVINYPQLLDELETKYAGASDDWPALGSAEVGPQIKNAGFLDFFIP